MVRAHTAYPSTQNKIGLKIIETGMKKTGCDVRKDSVTLTFQNYFLVAKA